MADNDSSPPNRSQKPAGGIPAGPIHRAIPDGDNRERLICRDCGFVHYRNPVVVVGAVVTWNDGNEADAERILLCRRAIAPQIGLWTLPAGYLELEESTEDGAVREAWEEACARITIDRLLAVYSVPRLSQVQTIYQATLVSPDIAAGDKYAINTSHCKGSSAHRLCLRVLLQILERLRAYLPVMVGSRWLLELHMIPRKLR